MWLGGYGTVLFNAAAIFDIISSVAAYWSLLEFSKASSISLTLFACAVALQEFTASTIIMASSDSSEISITSFRMFP